MKKNTYILIILSLTILLTFTIYIGISFFQENNKEFSLPSPLENIYPLPNDQVPQQVSLEVDLPVGYELVLVIDNYIIPSSEIQFIEATGVYIWKPGSNKSFESWQPGKHIIKITWNTIVGLPDFGEYEWEFTSY
ncbi:MAG: hypothetical protein O3A48_04010 [Actinomycetota bacterium]|nr:hypothetical protein [Actinomycetota bacterium]MDA3013683.1 hypothetical protein [Actinomycetota bacterium]